MDWDDYIEFGKKALHWGSNYRKSIRNYPVRSQLEPGHVYNSIPDLPPENPEKLDDIFEDFKTKIIPGITHWQHPRFFAYFPSNAAPASVFAEMLANTMGSQCMLWQTSPAATELEEKIIDWLRIGMGLPSGFKGVIQDTASSATLTAVLTMREKSLDWTGNKTGLSGRSKLRIYASEEVHSSIDRAIWFSGIGEDNLVRIPVYGDLRSMDPELLKKAIQKDKQDGHMPAGIIAATGGTSSGSCDNISVIADIAAKENLYLHVDAAWAGSAMICSEYRYLWQGIEKADSIVFNPHKWLGAQFDCSVQFLKDPSIQKNTLSISPEYLKTKGVDGITNLSDYTIQLGRRFRSLKLWFLIRSEGMSGLKKVIRNHVKWTENLHDKMKSLSNVEIVTSPILSLFTFRFIKNGSSNIDEINEKILAEINNEGKIYLTPTKVKNNYVIRFTAGTFEMEEADIEVAYNCIREKSESLNK